MNVFDVYQWSISPPDREACEAAVKALAEYAQTVHPAAKSFRTYRQSYGPLPLWTYFAVFEYESMKAWDEDTETPSCLEVWTPIFGMAQPGSFHSSLWADSQRESWFER
ncbi:MAG: hypothetical protein ACHQ01_05700 [Candidatus Limnocylindrales bacterium]